MAPVLLAFVIGCRWNSQLMKYSMLWIISAKRFTCSKIIGMYAHCVSLDQDDNLIAGWLVASQVNTCKLCSCELCYNQKETQGLKPATSFFSFPVKKKKGPCRDASSSEGLWGGISQFIFSPVSCGSSDLMPLSVAECSRKLAEERVFTVFQEKKEDFVLQAAYCMALQSIHFPKCDRCKVATEMVFLMSVKSEKGRIFQWWAVVVQFNLPMYANCRCSMPV